MAGEPIVSSHNTPYSSQPLGVDEIRLLAIERDDHTFRLTTQVHSLDKIPAFAAVSYVWGTACASKTVSCNGKDLMVNPSAFEMLQYLDADCLFWVDTICINQDDNEEKAIQVPLMERIYSEAAFVVVWAGIATPQMHTFMTELPRILEIGRRWTSNIAKGIDPRTQADCAMPSSDHPFWTGCIQLLCNSWFKRLWTFQEVIYAKRSIIFSDSAWIYPDDFIEFVLVGRQKGYFIHTQEEVGHIPDNYSDADIALLNLRLIQNIRRFMRQGGLWSFPYLLHALRDRDVKEPVDRIWGILGLICGGHRTRLASIVDYSDTGRREYWKTYLGVFAILIDETQELQLLNIPPVICSQRADFPTWCTDISGTFACTLSLYDSWNLPVDDPSQFYADFLMQQPSDRKDSLARRDSIIGYPKRSISFQENGTQLCIRGFAVDTIVEVVEDSRLQGASDYTNQANLSHILNHSLHPITMDWHRRGLSLARRLAYGPKHERSDIPEEYLMCFLTDHRIQENVHVTYSEAFGVATVCGNLNAFTIEHGRRVRELINRMKHLAGHSFFATKSGRFGIATPGCRPGDKLCVFYGGHPLYILRWPGYDAQMGATHSDGTAEFCGTAFVPHLMEPQQSDAARIGPDEIFVLR